MAYCSIHSEHCGCRTCQPLLTSEREALDEMTDREMVGYWNVLQFPGLVIGDGKDERHIEILDALLTERAIDHERGRRTVIA